LAADSVLLVSRCWGRDVSSDENEFADRLAALGTVGLMGRALGLQRDTSFELARVTATAWRSPSPLLAAKEDWEAKLR
jgi:hypothetical protein